MQIILGSLDITFYCCCVSRGMLDVGWVVPLVLWRGDVLSRWAKSQIQPEKVKRDRLGKVLQFIYTNAEHQQPLSHTRRVYLQAVWGSWLLFAVILVFPAVTFSKCAATWFCLLFLYVIILMYDAWFNSIVHNFKKSHQNVGHYLLKSFKAHRFL